MTAFDLMRELDSTLRAGDVDSCVERAVEALRSAKDSPFHIAINLDFTNPPEDVAEHFSRFLAKESSRFNVKAAYTETNGFSINPGRWFFDLFAYNSYGGHDDYGWLSDWQSDHFGDMTLTGMEALQEVYGSDAFRDEKYRESCDFSDLVVITKFQRLIKRAAPYIDGPGIPLLASAHDYAFLIYECRIGGEGSPGGIASKGRTLTTDVLQPSCDTVRLQDLINPDLLHDLLSTDECSRTVPESNRTLSDELASATTIPFFIGATRDEVHHALGTPNRNGTGIQGQAFEVFVQPGLAVDYDEEGTVTEIRAGWFEIGELTGTFKGAVFGVSLGDSKASYSAKLGPAHMSEDDSCGCTESSWRLGEFLLVLETWNEDGTEPPWGGYRAGDVKDITVTRVADSD